MRPLLLLFLLLTVTGSQAQTYRWTDATGRAIISDAPPPPGARNVVRSSEEAASTDGLPYATRKAAENFPVTLYTATNCQNECAQARELLNGRGIPFTEKPIRNQAEADEMKALLGEFFVPYLKVGKQSARGFSAGTWNDLLDLAGYPKTAPYGKKPAAEAAK